MNSPEVIGWWLGIVIGAILVAIAEYFNWKKKKK